MKITNIRVLNNFKVKLTNTKLSGVNASQSSIFEQGTRTPVIITEEPEDDFQEKFDRVFNYLISRYEPGWSAATQDIGKAATMQLLGISSAVNPLILGGTVEASFNYTTGDRDEGWFDVLTHPKNFASVVRTAYKSFDRARSPQKASNKFIQYNLNGIYAQDFLFDGGNAFFGYHPRFDWYPGNSLPSQLYMGLSANYDNGIRRSIIHSPYGNFGSPMNSYAGNWRRYPWLSDRYTAESFQFDMYLLLRENTTIRDLMNVDDGRSGDLGVIVNGVTDAYLNTSYKGICFAAGLVSRVPFNDYGRTGGGYSADQVLVGSPWIRYPEALTYSSWWGLPGERAGLCFAYETLTLFNGMTFPNSPQDLRDLVSKPPMSDVVGISYGYGNRLLQSLNDLSSAWGNSMEFIAYLGCLPYGTGFEMRIPFGLYRDPTIAGNKDYFKWRLDASVSHWKEKFKSPNDGFARVVMDASALIERTFHQWQAPGYTLWTNIASSGASYVENIPVEWARDQYNYTFGALSPDSNNGVILGVERFAQYMFKDDVGINDPTRNDQRRFAGDTNPRHWCLDDDKANDLFTSSHDMFLGQRKWGLTYSNSIWGMGICGTSELGEIMAVCTPDYNSDTSKSAMSAYPFFYNVFTEVQNNGDISWKRVPGTFFNNTTDGVPWINDRRFRLFYLYPAMLALNMSVVDYFHDGVGYYNHLNKSGWYDKTLGARFRPNMETTGNAPVVSNFPFPNRKTTTKPPQNFWTGFARTSEFELLYACMKGGITDGLDSLYFNELYEELKNGLIDPPDTSRTGFFRALDFAVFGASWTPGTTGSDGQSLYPSIVPLIKPASLFPDGNLFTYKGGVDPGSTAGMPVNEFNQIFVPYCEQIPYERRVLLPNYWLLDGPPNQRRNTYYFKRLADGATYTGTAGGITFLSTDYGGTWEYGDTSPLKFMTPWAYENRSVAKTSFKNFLSQAKDAGLLFKYVHDDCETLGALSPAGPFFAPMTEAQLITFATGANAYNQIPDARHLHAIVNDSRFNGITSSITNRTMAQEFKHNYDQVLSIFGLGSCGASAEQILSFFTGATGRNDFRYAYGNGLDVLRIAYAYDMTNYIFCQGDLKTKIIGESLHETPGFENCRVTSSELCTVSASEGKYGVDAGGHPIIRTHIPGYGHSTHSFGELAQYQIEDRGYPPNDSTDPDIRYGKEFGWHPVSEGGIRFDSVPYQAMISDLRKIRAIIRSRPEVLSEGLVVLINGNPSNGSAGARFVGIDGAKYYKEHIYHHCLSGVNYFVLFNKTSDMTLANEALVEWRNVSGNVVAVPCNDAGSTAGIDRIDLREAGTKMVATGAYTNDPNKRLWRLTVPASVSALAKVGTSQPDLPNIINIPTDSRGVWLEAPASYGKPNYEPVSALYSYELEDNRRMYTIYNIGVNGAAQEVTQVWNSVTDTFIATFKGDPFQSGTTRAYPWESNPANPSVSSPWHNVIYENCIDPYKWGSRAFYVYMPWGSFNTAWYLTPEIWRRTFTNLTGNTFAVPARWKGFTSAIKGLLEGTLAPAGKSAMNEPCNVMLYHGSNRGYHNYRFNSNALWDSFAGSTREKDSQYYEYLDSWTNALISMKSKDLTKGKLHITMDATSPSATPTSLPLYRSLGTGPYGYRSDELELADWYVFNKLKDAGISVYYEARSPKSMNRAVIDSGFANPEGHGVEGVTGATLGIQWSTQASHFEEYWLWYSNPSNADTNFDNHQKDSEHPGMVRMFGANFPIRLDGDPNRDPFKTKLNVQLSDGRGVTIDHVNTLNTLYTPHYYLWMIYALSDNYRKYYNKSVNSTVFKGIKLNTEHLIAYFYDRLAKSNVCLSVYNGVEDPRNKYWRIPTTIADSFKPLFDLTAFNESISGGGIGATYGSSANHGFWTQQGISYWNNNVLKTSFNQFINFLTTYSETHSPLGTTYGIGDDLFGEPQKFYGTTSDDLVNNVIPIIQV